jgi:hypothetical protein
VMASIGFVVGVIVGGPWGAFIGFVITVWGYAQLFWPLFQEQTRYSTSGAWINVYGYGWATAVWHIWFTANP